MPDDSDDDDYDGIHILYMYGDGSIHPKLTAVGDDEDDDGNKHPKLTAVDDAADDDEYFPSEGSEEEEDDDDDDDYADDSDENDYENDYENDDDDDDDFLFSKLEEVGFPKFLSSTMGGSKAPSAVKTACNRVLR